MTAHEHYRMAQRLLDSVVREDEVPTDDSTLVVANAIAAAQVHATLAQFDLLREIGDQLDTLPRSPRSVTP